MTTVLWRRASLESVPPSPRVRWHRSALEGAAVLRPQVRWHRAGLEGPAAVVVAGLLDLVVEPGVQVTVAPSLAGGLTASSWAFRVLPDPAGLTPAIALEGSGGVRTFVAPSVMPPVGGTVLIGVAATSGGATSPERVMRVTVLPRLHWVHTPQGWRGSDHRAVLP